MNTEEVERVARLMHETHRAFMRKRDERERIESRSWEEVDERYKERVRHVAKAVLADLSGAVSEPFVVAEGV